MENRQFKDQIDLVDAFWKGKWLVLSCTGIFAVVSVIIALSMTNVYKSETLLAPVASDSTTPGGLASLAGQFGGLASIAGLSLGGVTTDKTALAMEYLRSRTFLIDFINRHQLKVPLMAAKGWDQSSNKLLIDDEVYDIESKVWVRNVEPPKQPEPSGWEAYEVFLELMTLDRDKANGLVTLGIEHYSPILAKEWTELLIADLNQFMRDKDMNEATNSIGYLQQQVETTTIVGMQEALYELIEEQLKITMLAEVREEYAFSFVDPPLVPEQKFKPRRALICIVGTFAGGFLGAILSILVALRRKNSTS